MGMPADPEMGWGEAGKMGGLIACGRRYKNFNATGAHEHIQ